MKNLLNGIALLALIFFYCESISVQNIMEINLSIITTETLVEASATIQTTTETVELIRGDGINV